MKNGEINKVVVMVRAVESQIEYWKESEGHHYMVVLQWPWCSRACIFRKSWSAFNGRY